MVFRNLQGVRMKRRLVMAAVGIFVAVGVILLARTGLWTTSDSGIWTHQSGAYSVNYGEVGWKLGSQYTYDGKTTLVTFDSFGFGAQSRHCLIFETPLAHLGPGVDQAAANESIAFYTRERWAAGLGLDLDHIHYFSNEVSGLVRVASIAGDTYEQPATRLHYRSFVIATLAGGVHQELSCSVRLNARESFHDEVNAILASLRFAAPAANE